MIASFQDFQYCCRFIFQVYEEQIAMLDREDARLSRLAHNYRLKYMKPSFEEGCVLYHTDSEEGLVEFQRKHPEFFRYLAEADVFVARRDELYRVRDFLKERLMCVREWHNYRRYWGVTMRQAIQYIGSGQLFIQVRGGGDMNGFHPQVSIQSSESCLQVLQQSGSDVRLYRW